MGPSSVLWGHSSPKYTQSNGLSASKTLGPAQCLPLPVDPGVLRSVFQHEPAPKTALLHLADLVSCGGLGESWSPSQGYQEPHRPQATFGAHASLPSAHCKAGLQPSELLSTAHAKALGSARKRLFSLVWNTATHVAQPITFRLSLISSPFSDMVSCSSFPRSL